ncbi:hypothetical protein GF325_01905 [Candidatus Bathyarchaeota archaeon]|nr:hypothetical protein [Candidatus Bathyarchaeota archaeon]
MPMTGEILKIARERANPLAQLALARVPRCSFFSTRRNRLRSLFAQKLIYWYFKLKNRLEIRERHYLYEILKKDSDLLVVANHSSTPDVMIHQATHAHLNHLVYSFISSGGFNYRHLPILPTILHFSEQIPRFGPGPKSVNRMVDRLLLGDHVLLFPEGTYNRGLVMEGFTGVARVAFHYQEKKGKPLLILPSCSIGGREAYNPHKKYMRRVLHQKVESRPGQKIIIKFGEPFTLKFEETPSREDFREKTMEVMHHIAAIWGQKHVYPSRKRNNIDRWVNKQDGMRIYKG